MRSEETTDYDYKRTTSRIALIEALDSVTSYNGLAEIIVQWIEPGYFDESYDYLQWKWDKFRKFDAETRYQLQVIWMICVELFGDFGTSPRTGWIEDKHGFRRFILDITSLYREAKEAGLTDR